MNETTPSGPRGELPRWTVRILVPTDAEVYRAVRLRALGEQPPAFGTPVEDEPDLAATRLRLIESEDRCFFGAFVNRDLAGVVRFSRYSAANEKHRAYLAGLYVLPAYRGAGLGRALVEAALDRARSDGRLRRVNLTVVSQQQAAVALYESLGFRAYGVEEETFSSGGRYFDEILMTLPLVEPASAGRPQLRSTSETNQEMTN